MEQLFNELVDAGWLNRSEAMHFMSDAALSKAIRESTSPVFENIFNALKLVPYESVKILILGQDPYPNPLHAHGLAFSSKNPTTPGSLRNIFKALDSVYGSNLVEKKNNDLTPWAEHGVLLLNTSLTYKNVSDDNLAMKDNKKNQSKEKAFHMSVWAPFVDIIIKKLLMRDKKLVMLLWGGDAWNIVLKNIKKLGLSIDEQPNGKVVLQNSNILILHTDHPSQVKINLGGKFLEQAPQHLVECDKFLGADKINWTNL